MLRKARAGILSAMLNQHNYDAELLEALRQCLEGLEQVRLIDPEMADSIPQVKCALREKIAEIEDRNQLPRAA
jgi:hypothetical protein